MSPSPPDPRSDQELVAAVNDGDPTAFETLYHRHRDWVVRVAMRFSGHHEDALDVLQDVFAYLACRFPGFELTARLSTYLYPAVKQRALRIRERRGRYFTDDAVLDARTVASDSADAPREELAAVMAVLPDAQREVVLMRFVDDMSLAEIATSLEIPVGTVKSRLHKAINVLREDARTKRYFEE